MGGRQREPLSPKGGRSVSDHEWLIVKEYAQLKRVTEETVRRWIRSGKLEAERTTPDSGQWRIKNTRTSQKVA